MVTNRVVSLHTIAILNLHRILFDLFIK